MSKTTQSTKDKAMAARLKREGVTRTTGRCPICNKIVSVNSLHHHIITCR